MARTRREPLTRGGAEYLAVQALAFVAGDAELLSRFLAVTGISPSAIRQAAGEPGFLSGVIDFLSAHEPDLMAFSQASGRSPDEIVAARFLLAGTSEDGG